MHEGAPNTEMKSKSFVKNAYPPSWSNSTLLHLGTSLHRALCPSIFKVSDARKFGEQVSDELRWDQSNKNYIMTHNVAGVDWRFYKSPRAEPVLIYVNYWTNTQFDS
jgi:hypothetical protein